MAIEPARRTLARGADPDDPSFAITVILPDVPLCPAHAEELAQGQRQVGWCDEEPCRTYGELHTPSPCGGPFLGVEPGSGRGAKGASKIPSK